MGKTIDQMTSKELTDLCKALGWDKESERAKLPDWYGIPGIKFIWHNTQSDPEIEYKGHRCSCYLIEDTMWQRWIYPDDKTLDEKRENDLDGFDRYMLEKADEVYELCELALFPEK